VSCQSFLCGAKKNLMQLRLLAYNNVSFKEQQLTYELMLCFLLIFFLRWKLLVITIGKKYITFIVCDIFRTQFWTSSSEPSRSCSTKIKVAPARMQIKRASPVLTYCSSMQLSRSHKGRHIFGGAGTETVSWCCWNYGFLKNKIQCEIVVHFSNSRFTVCCHL
jgi:hypothetical protein